MDYIHPIEIGKVKLDNNIILAPMAGVSDLPFRMLCADHGFGMTCTEMVSAKAIMYNNKKTYTLLERGENEPVLSVQLFGHEPACISEMARRLEDEGVSYDILDINMGCPVPKVVNNSDGSALLNNPMLAGRIVEQTVKATSRPVTAKIRIGFDLDHINAAEMAHILEESGASAITVHGRTRSQYYSGEANWEVIGEVKSKVRIPVIGNGDVSTYSDIVKMHDMAGVDGYAIGRAARGNPWIARSILEQDDEYKPTWQEVKDMILTHARMLIDYKGEYIGIREMRKHFAWYTSGYSNAKNMREMINSIESIEELVTLLSKS